MKKIFTLITAIIFSLNAFSQPDWRWAKSAGGSFEEDNATNCAVDSYGNVYVTGYFNSPTITFGNIILNNAGFNDMFLVKYDRNGNVLWAKREGGISFDYGFGIALDSYGGVYVAGGFESPAITFGSSVFTNVGLAGYDIFLAKYDTAGNLKWARQAGGNVTDSPSGVSTDINGNIYITGTSSSTVLYFGSIALNLVYPMSYETYIAKYDSSGNPVWANTIEGNGADNGNSISADAYGGVYITGYFESDSLVFPSAVIHNAGTIGQMDMFLAKYNSATGLLEWASGMGGPSADAGQGVKADADGNVYVTGWFSSNSVTIGSTTLSNAGNVDMFIAKYDSSGNALWAESTGGISSDRGWGLTTDLDRNVYVTGYFMSPSVTFGNIVLTNFGGTCPFGYCSDVFIAKYDSAGNVLGARCVGGNYGDEGRSIGTDMDQNIYITGRYNSASINFGTTVLNNSSFQYYDAFIANLAAQAIGIEEQYSHDGFLIFPNPATTDLRITNAELRIESVDVYDIIGSRLTLPFDFAQGDTRLDVSSLAPGIYFVKVRGEKEERVAKFVKE